MVLSVSVVGMRLFTPQVGTAGVIEGDVVMVLSRYIKRKLKIITEMTFSIIIVIICAIVLLAIF